jgi:hypothetical protein
MPGVRPAVTTSSNVAGTTTRIAGHRGVSAERLALVIAILTGVSALGVSILILNHGVFTYTFDDAYIHLVLARSLTSGHYGFNLSEFSSPASSILFPVLLVPFVWAGVGSIAALLINTAALVATTYRLHRWIVEDLHAAPRLATAATLAMALGFNLVTLVFTGMEHSLQILLGVVIGEGLWRIGEGERRVGWLFWVAVATAPLVRYEMLAVSLTAVVFCLARTKAYGAAAMALAAVVAPLAAFSVFLMSRGLGWLPTSVLAHADYADVPRRGAAVIVTLARNVVINADSHAGAELTALAAMAVAGAARHPRHAGFALMALALLTAELAAGQIGWRYEVWALVAIGMMALSAWAPFDTLTAHPVVVAAAALCAALVSVPYLQNLALTPRAAHNIFSQQAQMGRAVERLGVRSVAVNDIGLVGWMNPSVYVVDLVGLASSEAPEHRRAGMDDPAWMDQQATRHGVDLAMIYPAWFSRVPATWVKVAELRLAGRPITTGSDLVAFYVPDAGRASAMTSVLQAFARELPTGASLSVF